MRSAAFDGRSASFFTLVLPQLADSGAGHAARVQVLGDGAQRLPRDQPSGDLAHDVGLLVVDHVLAAARPCPSRSPDQAAGLTLRRAVSSSSDHALALHFALPGVELSEQPGDPATVGRRKVEVLPLDDADADPRRSQQLDRLGPLATVAPQTRHLPDDDPVDPALAHELHQLDVARAMLPVQGADVVVAQRRDHVPAATTGQLLAVAKLSLDLDCLAGLVLADAPVQGDPDPRSRAAKAR